MRPLLLLLLLASATLMAACATTKNGANWWVADFTTRDKNYRPFTLDRIRIGMTRQALLSAIDLPHSIQAATQDSETLEFEKWQAIQGPDYVEERLLVLIRGGRVAEFHVVKDTVKTNPW